MSPEDAMTAPGSSVEESISSSLDTPSANVPGQDDSFLGRPSRAWLIVLLVVYAAFLATRFAPAIVAPDANGYWAQGSLLVTTGQTWFEPEADLQYIGMHWLLTPSGKYLSRYPPGLAVVVAGVYRLFGPAASVWVNPALALLALVGVYLLCAALTAPAWGLLGATAMALLPSFSHHALTCDSHMAVLCCLAWGMYLLVRWSDSGKLWQAFVAGLVLGCIPTVRYPEALYALGLGVFVLVNLRSRKRWWTHLLAAGAGAIIPIIPLLIRNQVLMGAFWRTAYSLTNEQTGFGWSYFRRHFVQYIQQIHGDGAGLFFPLGAAGIAAMCATRKRRDVGTMFALIVLPATLLYMAYYWAPRQMSTAVMRFVLPTFTCYVVAAVWALHHVLSSQPATVRTSVVSVLLILHAIWGGPEAWTETKRSQASREALARVTEELDQAVDDGQLVIAHSQIQQHLDFVRKWRLVDAMLLRGRMGPGPRFMDQVDDETPMPMQLKKQQRFAGKYDNMDPIEREFLIAEELHKWAGERKVYWIGTSAELDQMRGMCFSALDFDIVREFNMPDLPPEEMEGPMGGGMPPGGAPGGGGPAPPDDGGGRGLGPDGLLGGRFPGGNGGQDMNRQGMRRMGGRQGMMRRGRPGGGGMGRVDFLFGETIVIAEWIWDPSERPETPPQRDREPTFRNGPFRRPPW